MGIAYIVTCTFDDEAIRASFTAYLVERHVAEVCAAGGATADIIALDDACACEVRYMFPSREALSTYLRDHAPRLRDDAMLHMGDPPRVRVARRIGQTL